MLKKPATALLQHCTNRAQINLKKGTFSIGLWLLLFCILCGSLLYYVSHSYAMKTISKSNQETMTLPTEVTEATAWLKSKKLDNESFMLHEASYSPDLFETNSTFDSFDIPEDMKRQSSETTVYTHVSQIESSHHKTKNIIKIKDLSHTIVQGELFHGTLETAIDTELSGQLRAVLTQPVFGFNGFKELLPAGSRLIGRYQSATMNGVASMRIIVIWDRIVTPKGLSIRLTANASDRLGRTGLQADHVNRNLLSHLNAFSVFSLFSGQQTSLQSGETPLHDQNIKNKIKALKDQWHQKSMKIKPVLHIHPGSHITVFITQDIDLSSYKKEIA
ncbi:MAG: TrbI/VirB10 family protein [Endozoicomonadaceae bacterium]|nr:TrbI/VirB10 family protein [Endozoicomonadaceae bacterium]